MMEDKQQEKSKKKIVFYLIPILIFVGFISYMTIRTYTGEVKDAVTETTLSSEGFENLSDTFEEVLQENIYDKNEYINLNGLATRVLGINTLNERYKLDNGYLAREENFKYKTQYSDNVIALDKFLSDRGIDFLYLLAPSKEAFYDTEYAAGYESDARENISSMLDPLDEAGVKTLNMDSWYEENGWKTEDVFFKTDHHWMPQAALAAANCTMEYLEQNGLAVYDAELMEEDSYDITVLNDWFLGSHGKRVGIYYAGLDDISVYVPNFSTNYMFAGLKRDTTNWMYHDNPLNLSYMTNRDLFGSDPHCIYLYGDNPLQIITNTEAVNEQRLLVIGDSFRRCWQYFLTTQFQEVYSIDIRYYTDGTLAQYIEEIQPDIVIMCTDTYSLVDSVYSFGLDEYLQALKEDSNSNTDADILLDTAIVAQEDNNNNFAVICDNLEPGQTYTLTVDSSYYSGGEDLFVQMTLQDLSTNKAVYNRYFDANIDETQRWIFSVPDGNDIYAIYLYAGTKGHTQNTSVEVSNIILYEGIIEN